ncbi:MAG: helix-turn-helix domain-containing protein [Oceanobacter sp.]
MVKSIEAVSRAMTVLTRLREVSPLSLAELQASTGINKATLLRILKTLGESGWVYKSLGDNRYRLSPAATAGIPQPTREVQLAEASAPILEALQETLRWPSDIAVRDGNAMHLIETTRNRTTFTLNRHLIGFRPAMLYSGVGRCYLSFCPDEERKEILTSLRTNNDREGKLARDAIWINQLIEKTRQQGFGEREAAYYGAVGATGVEIEAIAVPIIKNNHLLGCLTAAWPKGAESRTTVIELFLPRLNASAKEIAERVG